MLTDPADVARALSAARAELPRPQQPLRWFHVPALPLTAAGKVDREALGGLLPLAARLTPGGRG